MLAVSRLALGSGYSCRFSAGGGQGGRTKPLDVVDPAADVLRPKNPGVPSPYTLGVAAIDALALTVFSRAFYS